MPKDEREYIPVTAIALKIGCSKNHVYNLIADGTLPVLDIGRGTRKKFRIPAAAVEKYLRDCVLPAPPTADEMAIYA